MELAAPLAGLDKRGGAGGAQKKAICSVDATEPAVILEADEPSVLVD